MSSKPLKVSFSALETYQLCPRKYYYTYIKKLPRKDQPWLVFGTFVHLALEKFHKYVLYFERRNREANHSELMKRAYLSACKIYNKRPSKNQMPLTDKQKTEAKVVLADYLKEAKQDFPKVIHIEKGFDFVLGDINVRGFIDRIDCPALNTYEVTDYKTSSKTYEVNKNRQLDLYAYSLKNIILKNKEIKIIKKLNFLKHGVVKQEEYTETDEKNLLKYLNKVSKDIIKNLESEEEPDWKIKENSFCFFCDHRAICQNSRGIFL